MKYEFTCTMYWDKNNERDKDVFQKYSELHLLMSGDEGRCDFAFEKGKKYKITIEECANAPTDDDPGNS